MSYNYYVLCLPCIGLSAVGIFADPFVKLHSALSVNCFLRTSYKLLTWC